ncbi:MAG: selenium cofactor biosynthesis protein YqeC, partial [Chloroflexota bacterium]
MVQTCMETLSDESLASALNLVPGSCVALIGAGGKTTTMLRMAGDLSAAERTVLVTTTTRIW